MRLKDWIKWQKLTYSEAAGRFGCAEISVRKMCCDKTPYRPGAKLALRITDATNGHVKLDDLLKPGSNVSQAAQAA